MAETVARALEPLASDSSDVSDALDVALSLWENGKRVDAIEWVKRATEAARKIDASRTASLARAVEEMERAVATPPPAPPAPVPPPVPQARPRSVPPPVPPPRALSKPPPPPATSMSRPPPPVAPAPTPRVEVRPAVKAPPPPAPASTKIDLTQSGDHTLRVRASVRVSVRTSVRDENLFVVRPLADGAQVPPGTREALLTFVDDPDDDASEEGS